MSESDGFQLVAKSRKVKKRSNIVDNEQELLLRIDKCKQNLLVDDSELYASKVLFKFRNILSNLSPVVNEARIVSYGLGSFEDSFSSRFQLAMLLILIDELKQRFRVELVELYDPLFTDLDKSVLENRLGFSVSKVNERAIKESSPDQLNLYYMPHCPKALYNNLLFANWSKEHLSSMILFGNSFKSIQETTSVKYSYLRDGFLLANEVDLEQRCDVTSSFNDLCLITFDTDKLVELTNNLDNKGHRVQPVYDENEDII